MFCCASIWKRYSFPRRRAGSPVQVSSSPRMAKLTPAACKIFTRALVTWILRSTRAPVHPTQKRYSASGLSANNGTYVLNRDRTMLLTGPAGRTRPEHIIGDHVTEHVYPAVGFFRSRQYGRGGGV